MPKGDLGMSAHLLVKHVRGQHFAWPLYPPPSSEAAGTGTGGCVWALLFIEVRWAGPGIRVRRVCRGAGERLCLLPSEDHSGMSSASVSFHFLSPFI